MSQKVKKLTLAEIQKIDKKNFGSVKKIVIHGCTVSVQQKIRDTEIDELVREVLNYLDEVIKRNMDMRSTLSPLLLVLIIKRFTDVEGIPNDLDGVIGAMKYMIDNDIIAPIINAFDENEFVRLNQQMNTILSGFNFVNTTLEETPIEDIQEEESVEQE